MKSILYLAVFCAVFFSSCKKEDIGSPATATLGNWKWDHSTGGIGGARIDPSANANVVLVLQGNLGYRLEKNGQVIVNDVFTVRTVNSEQVFTFQNLLTADQLSLYTDVSAKIENGQLVLTDYKVADGRQHFFIR